MCYRKHIALHAQRTILLLKATKFLFFIPLIITDICIPLLNYMSYKANGIGQELYINIIQYTQIFFPFLSVWWVVFIMRDFIEAEGNEMLFVNKSKNYLLDFIAVFTVYIFNVIILYIFYIRIFDNMKLELVKLILICIFYFGIVFFSAKLTNSITITLFFLMFYTLSNFFIYRYAGSFPLYYTCESANREIIFDNSMILSIIGVVLLIVGIKIPKKL